MASDPVGAMESAPSTQSSQRVVELKTKRHSLRSNLRELRLQLADHKTLLETTEHRIRSSKDVLRLKTSGIGRLDAVECPTCHRNLDPCTFDLTDQSATSVQAQIESLGKQRTALIKNIGVLVLALADASRANSGPHPGFLVLDEPLQQNPDPKHRKLMLQFFEQAAASTENQVIVTTSLQPEELARLRKAHVNVKALPGKKFLRPKPEEAPSAPPAKG
jgi:hypothetical protein